MVCKKLTYGKKALMAIVLIVTITATAILLSMITDYKAFEEKSSFTVDEVFDASYKIFKKTMGFSSGIEVTYWSEKKEGSPKNAPIFKSADHVLLNSRNFYIYTDGGGGLFKVNYKPTEIVASFECLLYFRGKELPGELIGILNYQSVGGIDNYRPNGSFISVTEFEELCAEVDIEGLSRRKAAEKLAERWIEKHNYVKR